MRERSPDIGYTRSERICWAELVLCSCECGNRLPCGLRYLLLLLLIVVVAKARQLTGHQASISPSASDLDNIKHNNHENSPVFDNVLVHPVTVAVRSLGI
jgi:hypothetical protein